MRTRLPRAEREAQMLATARALFAARGYADVTMDEVAGAVGVTKPLLYTYYGNKERLFLACMEPAAEALVESVVTAVQRADDAPGALRAGIHAFFAFLHADGDVWLGVGGSEVPLTPGDQFAIGENAFLLEVEEPGPATTMRTREPAQYPYRLVAALEGVGGVLARVEHMGEGYHHTVTAPHRASLAGTRAHGAGCSCPRSPGSAVSWRRSTGSARSGTSPSTRTVIISWPSRV